MAAPTSCNPAPEKPAPVRYAGARMNPEIRDTVCDVNIVDCYHYLDPYGNLYAHYLPKDTPIRIEIKKDNEDNENNEDDIVSEEAKAWKCMLQE
ncbi:expressed unknown protein [Seminavis robusta]|uniref:Uncharacterized protein n=1 Tax=Seminavis robusta TaxID=568900 RepID=A0A9N8D8Z8_9STRA|nr:expressed unknown protein [Seminavis robusta]|eukprot:Sro42_g025460.1 n/a (94) ;mRNA; f:28213-28494